MTSNKSSDLMVAIDYISHAACIDFANWLKEQSIHIVQTGKGNEWSSNMIGGPRYTSEQLYDIWKSRGTVE